MFHAGKLLIYAQDSHICLKILENVQYFPIKEADMIVNTKFLVSLFMRSNRVLQHCHTTQA